MALFNITKLKAVTFILLLITVSFLSFIIFDRYLIKKRAEFITEKVEAFKVFYNRVPESIDFISQEIDLERESICAFFNETIPGWGYCYYSPLEDKYIILIKGYFSTILYESDKNVILYNSPKYD